MAVGKVVPKNLNGDLDALATLIAAEPNISAAVVVPSANEVDVLRRHIKVTGTTANDVKAACETLVRKVNRGTSTGGTFTFTVDGQVTGAQAFNIAAATFQTNVNALSTVGSGATVTGTGTTGDPWIVTLPAKTNGSDRVVSGVGSLTGGDATLTITQPVANLQFMPGDEAVV
jgi:hypothetical protein